MTRAQTSNNRLNTFQQYMDGLVQDCSNSIANALELLQSSTKPSTRYRTQYDYKNAVYGSDFQPTFERSMVRSVYHEWNNHEASSVHSILTIDHCCTITGLPFLRCLQGLKSTRVLVQRHSPYSHIHRTGHDMKAIYIKYCTYKKCLQDNTHRE